MNIEQGVDVTGTTRAILAAAIGSALLLSATAFWAPAMAQTAPETTVAPETVDGQNPLPPGREAEGPSSDGAEVPLEAADAGTTRRGDAIEQKEQADGSPGEPVIGPSKTTAAQDAQAMPNEAKPADRDELAKRPEPTPEPTREPTPEPPPQPAAGPVRPRLIISSWPGAYGEAQSRAVIAPLARDLDIDIDRLVHTKSPPEPTKFDVAELDQSALLTACKAGRLASLDDIVSSDDLAAHAGDGAVDIDGDFIVPAPSNCGVPTFAWSSLLLVNSDAMKQLVQRRRFREPNRLQHLFDVKRYPGKRALIRNPRRLLEMALLGNDVGRDEVYARLATRDGQDRAFEILDRLAAHVVWVDGPREAIQTLDEGKTTMAMTYNGRAFRRLIAGHLQPIWDGHIIDYAAWAIAANTKQRDAARQFVLAATSTERLAAQARLWPYGPMRRSALRLAQRHSFLDTGLAQFQPTAPERLQQGLILDAAFWATHGEDLDRRFEDWLDGVPLGIRVPLPGKAELQPGQ